MLQEELGLAQDERLKQKVKSISQRRSSET
jgi:hypothetical protein